MPEDAPTRFPAHEKAMLDELLAQQLASGRRCLENLAQQSNAESRPSPLLRATLMEVSVLLDELRRTGEVLQRRIEELTRSLLEVEAQRRHYQELFDQVPDGYLMTGAAGVIGEANRAAFSLLGAGPECLLGKPLAQFVAEADRPALLALIAEPPREGSREAELHLRPHQGEPFAACVRLGAAFDDQGRPVGLYWLLRDITERKQSQAGLVQAERLAAIDQMMTGLVHESRNALQRTTACLAILALEVQDRPSALAYVERVRDAQNHLRHLYEEVRQYAASLRLNRRACQLGELVQEAWQQLEPLRRGRGARLRLGSSATDLHCLVDRFTMTQVFRNLLENALEAGPDPVEIDVQWSPASLGGKPALLVTLRDNGPGLAPEQREKLFEPFYTTKTHGTGLGLPIARRLVEANGGRIIVTDAPPPGVTIQITLPRGTP